MSTVLKKLKEFSNTGFSSNVDNEGDRLIAKNGKFNVKKEGLNFSKHFNLFHLLINMPAISFFICLLVAFIAINLFFTTIYLMIGLEDLHGANQTQPFFDAFYFSAQTLTTVGYGSLYPAGKLIGMVASFEAFIGLLSFAVSTGLLYGRFSKPRPKIMFSKNDFLSSRY